MSGALPIARPGRPGSWQVIARSKKIAAAWEELFNQASGECQRVFDQLSADPKIMMVTGSIPWKVKPEREATTVGTISDGRLMWVVVQESGTSLMKSRLVRSKTPLRYGHY